MTDFKLCICKLFQDHPLCAYRTQEQGRHTLKVLLIGYGSRADLFFDALLAHGQLLNTDLELTIAAPNASGSRQALEERAPELGRFARISLDGNILSDPADDVRLADIRFRKTAMTEAGIEKLFRSGTDYSYVVISTGHDDKNLTLAQACAGTAFGHPTLIAYVQKKKAELPRTVCGDTGVYVVREDENEVFRDQVEQIALNLQYVYSKAQNDRTPFARIIKEFNDPYSYISNLEAALHIRSKLYCCGITDTDPAAAARQFSLQMEADPTLVRRLSAVEHRRWLVSKLTAGYCQLTDLNKIYTGGNTTRSSKEKWHCCMVPSETAGSTPLTEADWDAPTIRDTLDPLDRISVEIHQQCGRIYQTRENQIMALLHSLQNELTSNSVFTARTIRTSRTLERVIGHMSQKKRNTVHLYRRVITDFAAQIEEEGGAMFSFLLDMLESIRTSLEPLIEYISYKDYKAQDLIMVEQIPFALTHRCQPVLLKLFSEKNAENLFSAWQMDGKSIIFCSMAFDLAELRNILSKMQDLMRFFRCYSALSDISWTLLVPQSVYDRQEDFESLMKGLDCDLVPIESWTTQHLEDALKPVFEDCRVEYLDCTGGNPLLTHAALTCAGDFGVGSFYVHEGRMYSISGAEELSYPAPRKNISVKEMFAMTGAVYNLSASDKCSDFSMVYDQMFDIAYRHRFTWAPFCSFLYQHLCSSSRELSTYDFIPRDTDNPTALTKGIWRKNHVFSETADAVTAVMPCLKKIEKSRIIRDLTVTKALGSGYDIRFQTNPLYEPAAGTDDSACRFIRVLSACIDAYTADQAVTFDSNTRHFEWTDLEVRDLPLNEILQDHNEMQGILQDLKRAGFLRHYQENAETNTASFRMASADVLSCLTKAGTALEYELYYAAMLEGHFTDVEMGCEFHHTSGPNAAKNEIDVICSRGISSLFISAKFRFPRALGLNFSSDGGELSGEPIFKYILYEILLESEKFGINAKAVLADPMMTMFDTAPNGVRRLNRIAQQAMSRGVYFLGQEAFKSPQTLARALDRIMDGEEHWERF